MSELMNLPGDFSRAIHCGSYACFWLFACSRLVKSRVLKKKNCLSSVSCNQKAVLGGVCYLFFLDNLQGTKWPSSCNYHTPLLCSGSFPRLFPRLQTGAISIAGAYVGAAQGASLAKIKESLKQGSQIPAVQS